MDDLGRSRSTFLRLFTAREDFRRGHSERGAQAGQRWKSLQVLPGVERGGYLEFKFRLTEEIMKVASRAKIVEAVNAEGIPLAADRYSDINFTYGSLHTAPLFNTFNLRSVGGCFYDPSRKPEEHPVPSLPNSEAVTGCLAGMEAYADMDPEIVAKMAVGICKVMERVEHFGE